MKPLTIPLIFLLFFTACNEQKTENETMADGPKRDTTNYRAVIEETNKMFTAAALKGDSASFITSLYHPDASIYAPNEPEMDAKKTASMMTQFPKMGISSFTLNTKEIFEGEETITEVGTYEMGDGRKTIDNGKYMVVWKKDGDKWKLFRDIWNSDHPYSPPPPSPKK